MRNTVRILQGALRETSEFTEDWLQRRLVISRTSERDEGCCIFSQPAAEAPWRGRMATRGSQNSMEPSVLALNQSWRLSSSTGAAFALSSLIFRMLASTRAVSLRFRSILGTSSERSTLEATVDATTKATAVHPLQTL